jgi:hypothetical protein
MFPGPAIPGMTGIWPACPILAIEACIVAII